jgi:hypothetical protein
MTSACFTSISHAVILKQQRAAYATVLSTAHCSAHRAIILKLMTLFDYARLAEDVQQRKQPAIHFAAAALLLLVNLLLLLLDAAGLLLATGAAPKAAAPSFARGSSNAYHCCVSDVLLLLSAEQVRTTAAKLAGN